MRHDGQRPGLGLAAARLLTTEHAAIEGTAVLDLAGPTPAAEVDVAVVLSWAAAPIGVRGRLSGRGR